MISILIKGATFSADLFYKAVMFEQYRPNCMVDFSEEQMGP